MNATHLATRVGSATSARDRAVTLHGPRTRFCHQMPAEAFESFQRLSACLSYYHCALAGVGFCLCVKHAILGEVGLLDEACGSGSNEENDLVVAARTAAGCSVMRRTSAGNGSTPAATTWRPAWRCRRLCRGPSIPAT